MPKAGVDTAQCVERHSLPPGGALSRVAPPPVLGSEARLECVIPLATESGWSDSAATANPSSYSEFVIIIALLISTLGATLRVVG